MAMKCMLTALLLTCFLVLLLIIIFSNLSSDENESRYFAASDDFVQKFLNIENERLMLNNNPIRILDMDNFQYVIDTKCNYSLEDIEDFEDDNRQVKAVWIITSYAGDALKRNLIRNAYKIEELKKLGIRRIFLLGILDDEAQIKTGVTQADIENEAKKFHDIIQGNFIEAYKNLTYKHLMGLQWAVDKCSLGYSYIMKMDDDIIVNLYEAMTLLQNKIRSNTKEDFLMGYVLEHMTPIRNKLDKWYVTEEEFPKKTYPSFLSGWFYVVDMLTALKLLYQSKHHSKYFWIDDVFVTGILREEAGIHNIQNIKEFFTSDYRFLECCLKDKEIPKYKCDFIVGPDGGEKNLLLTFQKFSADCYYKYKCISRAKDELLKDKCILDYANFNLGIGSVQIETVFSNAVL